MPRKFLSFLKVFFSVGFAVVLLYLVFKNVDWTDFWQKAKAVNYAWVLFSIGLSMTTYFSRAYRWNILLKPMGYHLKTSRTTLAVLVGYLANMALPRLGEITRCGILNKNDRVPVPVALGSVVTERLVDLISLLILVAISLLIESERILSFFGTAFEGFSIPTYVIVLVLLLGLMGIAGLIFLIRRRDRFSGRLGELIQGFIAGFLSLKDIQNPLGFIASTVAIWLGYFLMSYVIIFSLPETAHLGIGGGFMLLVTGGIALALPVQSGFGTYHGMVSGMLLLYAVEENTGIFLATLLHTSQVVAIAIFGTIALLISFLINRSPDVSDQE